MDEGKTPKAILTSMEVKDIIASSYGEDGRRCYKVQWKESWVFEEHLVNCKHLVAKYWKENHQGTKQQNNANIAKPVIRRNAIQRLMSTRKRDSNGKAKKDIEMTASKLNQQDSSKGPSNATEMDGVWVLEDSNQESEGPEKHIDDDDIDSETSHNDSMDDSDYEDSPTKKKSRSSTATPYELKCDICKVEFYTISEFRKHYATQHPGIKPFDCEVCHSRFSKKENLVRHMRLHTGDYPYFCNFCGKTASDPSTLRRHIRGKHKTEARNANEAIDKSTPRKINRSHSSIICHICRKEMESIKALKLHFHSEHPDSRPFPCHICEKSFEKKENLTRHIRVHTNDRIYSCALCGKSFTDSSTLRKHVKSQICQLKRRSGKRVEKAVAEAIQTRGKVISASDIDPSAIIKRESEGLITDAQDISAGTQSSETEAEFVIEASTSQQEQAERTQEKEQINSIESLLQTIKQVNELGTAVQANVSDLQIA